MRKTQRLLPRSGSSDELPAPGDASAIGDVARVRALLIAAARRGEALSYSDLLDRLGQRFTRPKMRALCRTLDAIDAAGSAAGEPDLAVLVVRTGYRGRGGGRRGRRCARGTVAHGRDRRPWPLFASSRRAPSASGANGHDA